MRTQRCSLKGYKINYSTNTITMNYKFAKKAQDFGSPEYELMKMIKEDFPMMTTVVEAGRKITSTNVKKRLTYANIEKHIKGYANADELMERFELAVQMSKPLASPYKYVCDWFKDQFPEYDKPVASISRALEGVELIDLPEINNYERKENYIA